MLRMYFSAAIIVVQTTIADAATIKMSDLFGFSIESSYTEHKQHRHDAREKWVQDDCTWIDKYYISSIAHIFSMNDSILSGGRVGHHDAHVTESGTVFKWDNAGFFQHVYKPGDKEHATFFVVKKIFVSRSPAGFNCRVSYEEHLLPGQKSFMELGLDGRNHEYLYGAGRQDFCRVSKGNIFE